MSYAIIETGGKQLRVEPGRFYDIDLLPVEAGEKISIDNVLLIQNDNEVHIGQPHVAGAVVQGTIMQHLRGKKIIVYKMRRKKKTRKKRGHRQELTRLMIDSINLNGTVLAGAETTSTETSQAPVAAEATVEVVSEPAEVAASEAE
ncbi:MAG: 50S ribosomal protein L21 [Microcoleaceae cyanobacterium MO_207.B10]|nr:50S ribosomal protein L21 [Microcoleaceae cyanobacterium MO_207.B10]